MPRNTLHRALSGFRTSKKAVSYGGDEVGGVEEKPQSIEQLLVSDEANWNNRGSLAKGASLNSPLGRETSLQAPLDSHAPGAVSSML